MKRIDVSDPIPNSPERYHKNLIKFKQRATFSGAVRSRRMRGTVG